MNGHAIGTEAQGKPSSLCAQMNADTVRILQPHLARAMLAGCIPSASLTIDTVEVFEPVEIVDGACRIKPRNADPTDPQPA